MRNVTRLLLLVLALFFKSFLPAVLAQPIAVSVTPAGPLRFCGPAGRTLTATASNPGFVSGTGFNDNVYAVVRQPNGQLLMGGKFFSYGATSRIHLARLAADGTLDAGFVPSGVPFSAAVLCLAVQPDGKIVAGGNQVLVGGANRGFLMRFNTDGSPDAGFAVTGAGSDFDSTIDDLIVQPDGTILVSGDFNNVGSTAASHIVRLLPNGAVDPAYTGAVFINGTVFSMARQADGRVLIGGIFTTVNGVARPCMARLNADGSTDATFAPASGPAGFGLGTDVTDILIQPDNQVLVVGNFTSYDGVPRGRVARLNPNGTLDAGFVPTGTGFSNKASNLALQPDGKVLVGGFFTSFNGTGQKFLARLTTTGAHDTSFSSPGTGFDMGVNATALLPDGTVVAGGFFEDFNGTAVGRVARLNADGTLLSGAGTPVPGVSYTWSNGDSGPSISVNGSGSYTATATAGSRTGTSNTVVVTVDNPPAISSFSPASGPVGTVITITGTGLGTVASASDVTVNGTSVSALTVDPSGTSLTATVAAGTNSGTIAVTTPCGTATSATAFTVTSSVFQLISTNPARNGGNVGAGAALTVVFNQPLDPGTAGAVHQFSAQGGGHRALGPTVPGSGGTNSATFTHNPAFLPGELVSLSITTQARSASTGQVLDRGHVRQFRVAAGTGPATFAPGLLGPPTAPGAFVPTLADVNGDGRLDLLTLNDSGAGAGSGSVSSYLGLVGGGFSGTGATVALGQSAYNMVLADFDNDGDLDLAATNASIVSGAYRVSIRLNTGGTFGGGADIAVGTMPYALAAGDVDADGDLDLVVTDVFTSSTDAYLLRNTGAGSFAAAVPIAVGNRSDAVALADLNNDDYLDLVLTHLDLGTATYHLGTGSGTFGSGASLALGRDTGPLAVGDFNNDGFVDLAFVISNIGSNGAVRIFLNTGGSGFGPGASVGVGVRPFDVAAGDLDGDGDLDLMVTNRGNGPAVVPLSLLLNNGSGSFSPGAAPCAVGHAYGLALADLDGDNDLDVVTVGPESYRWLNQTVSPAAVTGFAPGSAPHGATVVVSGTGFMGATAVLFNGTTAYTFTVDSPTQITAVVPPYATTGPISVVGACGTLVSVIPFGVIPVPFRLVSTIPSFNARTLPADGIATLLFDQRFGLGTAGAVHQFGSQTHGHYYLSGTAAGSAGSNSVNMYPSQDYAPGEAVSLTITTEARSAISGLPLDRGHVRQWRTAAGTGPGTFAAGANVNTGDVPCGVALGDVNGDDILDLVTASANSPATVSVRLGLAGGGFAATGATVPVGTSTTVGVAPINLVLADFDNDGDLDLATANHGLISTSTGTVTNTGSVSIRLNTGGSFGGSTELAAGTNPYALAAGDVDADGDLDLLVTNVAFGSTNAYLLRNTGSGGFAAAVAVPVGGTGSSVALADLNNDGYLDAVVCHFPLNTVGIALGNGSSFGPVAALAVGVDANDVAVGDYNGDGFADLAITNVGSDVTLGTGAVEVRLNNGSGGFPTGSRSPVGDYPWAIETGDVDGDGDLDLVTGNRGISAINAPLTVLRNNGSGAFAPMPAPCTNGSSYNLALADLDGDRDLDIVTANTGAATATVWLNQVVPAAATVSHFTPGGGGAGTSVVITGTGFTGSTAVAFNGTAASSFVVNSATRITAVVPAGATHGPISVTAGCGTASSTDDFYPYPNLVVSTTQAIPAGNYYNVTVTGTGNGTLAGNVAVYGDLRVANGGVLSDGCQGLIVHGRLEFDPTTTTGAGPTLYVCAPQGISLGAMPGAIQLLGTLSVTAGVNYVYNGTGLQQGGTGLFGLAGSLTVANAAGLTLTVPLDVYRHVTLPTAGNLNLNSQALRLMSNATGTGLVVNSSTGIVVGGTATMQRYIAPAGGYTGAGYHHYSSPVSGCPVAGLAVGSYTPTINPTYNSSARPADVRPFPTIFGYEQARLATTSNNLSLFDKGWVSPLALTEGLAVGRGYAVHINPSLTVGFTGTLNTGTYTYSLARNTGPAVAAESGWHFVGNPYPAPIDWSRTTPADRTGLDAALYVFAASGAYTGSYRAYVNGIGSGDPLLAAGQGFWVRVSSGTPSATLRFRDAHRITDYSTPGTFQRSTADARPRLRLALQAASGTNIPADDLFVYTEAGATTGTDAAFDAAKLPNPSGLNLSAVTPSGDLLAIQGLPVLAAATVVPLTLNLPTAGRFELAVSELLNFAPGTVITLHDAATGASTVLTPASRYAFTSTTTALAARFWLNLTPAAVPLTTASQVLADAVLLYPNPAKGSFLLQVPGGKAATDVVMVNALGQVVRHLVLGTGATSVDVRGLAAGVYTLRLVLDGQPVAKRVVLE